MNTAAFDRRGACPALSAPMQTGDGLLVRLNPVSEGLTPGQLIGLCESASRHGNGTMEITARGSLQIRGLTDKSAISLADDVNLLGIDVRTGVPIDISPSAGIDPTEITDPRPLAEAMRTGIQNAGLSRRLGPKVSVVIDSGGQIDLSTISADIRLTAGRRRTGALWRIAIGGTALTAEPMGASSEQGAIAFALDLLEQIAERGADARARDVVGTPAPNRFPDREAMSQTPPLRLGLRPRHLSPEGRGTQAGETPESQNPGSSPLWGEVARRAGEGLPNLRPITLINGRLALPIALPFGSIAAETLAELGKAAANLGLTDIRLAPGRRLLLLCDRTQAEALAAKAAALGFVTNPSDPRLSISACAGAPACASGYIATKALAEKLVAEQPELVAAAGHIHISGCPKGCAHPAAAPLTLVGSPQGVGVVANGTARQAPSVQVKLEDVPAHLPSLLRAVTAGAVTARDHR